MSVPQGNFAVIQGVASLNIVTKSTVGILYPPYALKYQMSSLPMHTHWTFLRVQMQAFIHPMSLASHLQCNGGRSKEGNKLLTDNSYKLTDTCWQSNEK